jgi:hypothetical protein
LKLKFGIESENRRPRLVFGGLSKFEAEMSTTLAVDRLLLRFLAKPEVEVGEPEVGELVR